MVTSRRDAVPYASCDSADGRAPTSTCGRSVAAVGAGDAAPPGSSGPVQAADGWREVDLAVVVAQRLVGE
jgi:hypothetical protein